MSLAWSSVKALSIPVGGVARDVKRVSVGGVTVWTKPNPVPYDSEVEYIESTGTQWIDTGVTATSGMISCNLLLTSGGTVNYMGYFGKAASDAGNQFYKYRTICYYERSIDYYCLEDGYSYTRVGRGASFQLLLSNHVWKVVPRTSSGTVDGKFLIFNCPSTSGRGHMRLFSFSILDEFGTPVRDYIPVRKDTVGYLYDRANPTGGPLGNGLYGNSGTGAFVVGPDKGTSLSMSPFLYLEETDLNPSDADATESETQEEPDESS